jgi:hypothetical protein
MDLKTPDWTQIDWGRTGALVAGLVVAIFAIRILNAIVRKVLRKSQRPAPRGRFVSAALTLAGAVVATAVAGTGMWKFFGDVLHIDSLWLRGSLFAFFEIALFASAMRARQNLLDDIARKAESPTTGVDGKAVWVIAGTSGVFSAMDAASLAEATFRLAAPLLAAWLWERGLAAHRRQARGARRAIHWALTTERVLVWLRLAEPTDRGIGDVDAARRRTRLVRAAARRDRLSAKGAWWLRMNIAEWRFTRQLDSGMAHLSIGTDASARALVLDELATRTQAGRILTADAVAHLDPWGLISGPASDDLAGLAAATDLPQAPVSPSGPTLTGEVVPAQMAEVIRIPAARAAVVARALKASDPALTAAQIGELIGRKESTVRGYLGSDTGGFPIIPLTDGSASKRPLKKAAPEPFQTGFALPPKPTTTA